MSNITHVPCWPPLEADAIRCLEHTRAILGAEIKFVPEPSLPRNEYGYSDIENGAPTVWLRPLQPNLQTTIIHELHHLQLRARGFPLCWLWVRRSSDLRIPNCSNREEFLREVTNRIQVTLEHHIIYQIMRRDFPALDPIDDLSRDIQQIIGGQIGGQEPLLASWRRALVYFQCGIELEGNPLLKEIADWFRSRGWSHDLRVGKNICAEVLRVRPQKPRSFVSVFVSCFNILLSGCNRGRVAGWTAQEGDKKRRVLVRVLPAVTKV